MEEEASPFPQHLGAPKHTHTRARAGKAFILCRVKDKTTHTDGWLFSSTQNHKRRQDNEIHERATDTLVNFETVKVRARSRVCVCLCECVCVCFKS